MKFVEFLFLRKLVKDMSNRLDESVFDDISKVKSERDITVKSDILARLLFYVEMHQGSLGNTDLKLFYTDVSIEEKLKQIETTINNNLPKFQKTLDKVKDKIKQNKEYEIYSSITRFFKNEKRIPAGFQIQ